MRYLFEIQCIILGILVVLIILAAMWRIAPEAMSPTVTRNNLCLAYDTYMVTHEPIAQLETLCATP